MIDDHPPTLSIISFATLPAAGFAYIHGSNAGAVDCSGQSAQRSLRGRSITPTVCSLDCCRRVFGVMNSWPTGKQLDTDALCAKSTRPTDVSRRCLASYVLYCRQRKRRVRRHHACICCSWPTHVSLCFTDAIPYGTMFACFPRGLAMYSNAMADLRFCKEGKTGQTARPNRLRAESGVLEMEPLLNRR